MNEKIAQLKYESINYFDGVKADIDAKAQTLILDLDSRIEQLFGSAKKNERNVINKRKKLEKKRHALLESNKNMIFLVEKKNLRGFLLLSIVQKYPKMGVKFTILAK